MSPSAQCDPLLVQFLCHSHPAISSQRAEPSTSLLPLLRELQRAEVTSRAPLLQTGQSIALSLSSQGMPYKSVTNFVVLWTLLSYLTPFFVL